MIEYEWVLSDLRKNLQDKNIRRVYRALSVVMPTELEEHLVKSGAILWEEFTKSAVNKYDIKAVMSQQLGSFDVGLCVLPPIGSLYKDTEVDTIFGSTTKK